jgi:hypothetical protein
MLVAGVIEKELPLVGRGELRRDDAMALHAFLRACVSRGRLGGAGLLRLRVGDARARHQNEHDPE